MTFSCLLSGPKSLSIPCLNWKLRHQIASKTTAITPCGSFRSGHMMIMRAYNVQRLGHLIQVVRLKYDERGDERVSRY